MQGQSSVQTPKVVARHLRWLLACSKPFKSHAIAAVGCLGASQGQDEINRAPIAGD
jgi:hypothetical protein